MTIQPLPGFILLTSYKEKKTQSGFHVADNKADKESVGKVLAVGDSYMYYTGSSSVETNPPCKVGDIVIYSNIGAQRYLDFTTGETLFLVRFHNEPYYSQIIAIIYEK